MLVALLTVVAPAAVAASQSGAPKVTLGKLPSAVTRGRPFSITAVASGGSHGSAAAQMTFALSRDKKLSGKDPRLGSLSIKSIAAHKKRTLRVKLTVPRSAAAGTYHFLACEKLKGKKHHNSCRSPRSTNVAGNGVFPSSIPKSLHGISPRPRSVTPHLDNAHAVSGSVTPGGGGTLHATGANGAQYTLTVPGGAVLSSLTVTMTPLSSVGGLGMSGGLLGGVQLNPDGLQLLKPARLTIVPASGAPTSGRTGFGYQGGGKNLGLVPHDPGGQLSFEITHFSGDGAGSATNADLAAQNNHAPLGTADQFRQEAQRLQRTNNSSGLASLFNS